MSHEGIPGKTSSPFPLWSPSPQEKRLPLAISHVWLLVCILPFWIRGACFFKNLRSAPAEMPAFYSRVLTALYFFKVAFSTFWFKFGATLRRQAERSDSEARSEAPNLT